ncbi:MAG: hypothetical protein IT195_14410 [Microthrixaceae bacterium]|nr:hypothetical protein [Microthrixaceae bacterium]HPZ95204.1 hypothetical protein [Mycobacterium sp.]HQE16367.1 hypothetical protein [Mycobacterium sp.]
MANSLMRYRIGIAAAASVVMTAGLVAIPQQGVGVGSARVAVAAVQLDAVLAAEVSALALAVPETDSAATTPIPDASTIQESVDAAVLGIRQALWTVGVLVGTVVGFAIAPLWWLGHSVTFPFYMRMTKPESFSSPNYISNGFDTIPWLMAPLFLGFTISRDLAASGPTAARSAEAVTPDGTQTVAAASAESLEVLRPASDPTTDPAVRPTARAKVSAPRAKTPVPLSAATTAQADEAATVPAAETPSAGRGKAITSKSDAQRANRAEMTKAGPRH